MKDTELHEHFDGSPFAESKIEGNVISNVKLLGKVSRNGRRYTDNALNEAAQQYRGVKVYFDHPTDRELRERKGVRSVRDMVGVIRASRRVGDEVRGDIVALDFGENSPAKFLAAVAEQAPEAVGFSHRASGQVRRVDGVDLVESITKVHAHELVSEPATTAGLFESVNNDDPAEEHDDMKIEDITLAQLRESRPDIVKAITESAADESETERLKAENKALQAKLDEATVREQERAHGEMVATKLAEAKLPERLVTEHFRTALMAADDEKAVDEMIADRKSLVGALKSGPKSSEGEEIKEHDEGNEVTESKLAEAAVALLG